MERDGKQAVFAGDFSTMWRLGIREPLWHMTWDWWWWLVMIDDPRETAGGSNSWSSGQPRTTTEWR